MGNAAAPDPLLGKEIAHCLIRRKLGAGGMGTVYLGDHSGLHKPVAIKVLAAEFSKDPGFVARFMREARLAAKLEHPNIVQVYDLGEEKGVHYILMQYVEGRGLDAALRERKKLTASEAVSIAKRVAAALGVAHRQGIVHRDIKPANILISKDGLVKVADFGLAKDPDANRSITGTQEIVGTPYYMSPEQAKGEKVDARSDLYSLGATLYHMATGRRPFDGDTPLSVVLKQINTSLVPASEVDPGVPAALSAVITRLMAKDPAQRYGSAEELIRDLEAVKQGGGSGLKRALVPSPRKAAMVALPVAGILVVGIVIGGVLAGPKAEVPTAAAPGVKPASVPDPPKPVPDPPPKPAPVAPPRDVLGKFKDLQERKAGEEVMARTEEFLKTVTKKDTKAMGAMLDRLSFGDAGEPGAMEALFPKASNEKTQLERWEVEEVTVRSRFPRGLPTNATVLLTYHLTVPKGTMSVRGQALHWARRGDGQWYVARPSNMMK